MFCDALYAMRLLRECFGVLCDPAFFGKARKRQAAVNM
jgi:hypothetical protein